MSSDPTRRARSGPPTPPPRLERVPTGYTPPPIKHGLTPAPLPSAALQTVSLTAEAAIRAGRHHRGELARDSTLRLLYLVAARKTAGRLRVRTTGREYVITFRAGIPVHAQSTEPADDLVRFLLDRGLVHPGALVDREPAEDGEFALVSALLARRDAAELGPLVREHGARVTARALQVERGEWEWEPHVYAPAPGVPLGSPLLLLAEAVRAMDEAALRRRLGARGEQRARPAPAAIALEDLGLGASELAAARRLDGSASPAEVARSSPGEAATVLRTALLLLETGLLTAG